MAALIGKTALVTGAARGLGFAIGKRLAQEGATVDVAAMAAWLATEDAPFVTGAALNVSGGEALFF